MTCDFETCDRKATRRGLCTAHYRQWHRGTVLRPLRPRKELHKDAQGRVCTSCEVYKPWSDYYKSKGRVAAVCIDCQCAYDRKRTRNNAR